MSTPLLPGRPGTRGDNLLPPAEAAAARNLERRAEVRVADEEDQEFFGREPSPADLRQLLAGINPGDETGLHVRLLLTRLLPEDEFDEAIRHGEVAMAGAEEDPALRF